MVTCKEYDELSPEWKQQVDDLIKKMKGKSHIADVIVEKSDLSSYDLKVTVCKYNTRKGWATIGYLRNDLFRGGVWRLTYKPRLAKDERSTAGKTSSYS